MNFSALFDPTFCVRLTLALLHFLWLGALIGLLAWAGGLLLRRSSAHARYLIQLAALLLMAACLPLAFLLLGDDVAARRAADAADSASNNAGNIADREASDAWAASHAAETSGSSDVDSHSRDGGPRRAAMGVSQAPLGPDPSRRLDASFPTAASPSVAATAPPLRWRLLERGAPYVAAAYLAGVVFVLLRLLRGACAGHRLTRRGSVVRDRGLLERARVQAELFRLRAAPPLRWCGEISIPIVIGVVKPIIMLPAAAATGLSLDQLQLLLTHELAHVRRHDLAVNLLQRVIEAALFFHPAVWLISRRIGVERELACDEFVLAVGCERAQYADALVRMAELSAAARGRRPAAIAGLAATGEAPTEFKRRVLKVLGVDAPAPASLSRLGVAAMAALILLSAVMPIAWRPAAAATDHPPNPLQVKDSRGAPKSETGRTLVSDDEKGAKKDAGKGAKSGDEKGADGVDVKGGKPDSDSHRAALAALDTAPMPECRALIKRLDDIGETRLASAARERLAKRWKRIAEQPVAAFLRDLPKPVPNAEPTIDRGDLIGVQTELDGVWSTGKGTADNWTDWIVRKQDKYRVDRLHLLFDAAEGYRRVDDAAAAARVLQAGLAGHEIYDSELPKLINKYWPITDDAPAKSLGPGPEAWTLVNYLGELSSAQQALGDIDRAIVTQSRLTLACFMLSWKHPAAAPTQRARELWALIRRQPESPPPLFWFQLVDESRPRHAFDLSSAGPRGQPLTHHHYNVAAAPSLDFRELKVTARVKGRAGLLDCYRINAAGKHETIAALRPAADGDEEQTLTRAFQVPAGTGLVQFMVAGKGFRVGEVRVEATFTVRALQKGPPDEAPKAASDNAAPLARLVTIEAENVPLKTVLEKLASSAGLTAELDADALAQVGLDLQQPISITFRDLPLQRALGRVIDWQTHLGAIREIRGKKLVFTTLAARQRRTAERLPEWMKPLYSHGLLATLDDDNEVVGLTVGGVVTNELLARFVELPQLRELEIEVTKGLTPEGLAHLGRMLRLKKLSLYNVNTEGAALGDDAIRSVVGLASLRELSVNECGTTDAGARLLEQLPQLTSLSLRQEGRLTDAALESIGKLTRLESLSLDSYVGTARLGRMAFSAAGIRQLRGLKELRSLHLVGHVIPADALDFPKLTSLGLGHSSVDDNVAARIGELRALNALELTYCNVGDAGLQAIAGLPGLRRLNISGLTITDAGIEHLRTHRRLEHIALRVSGLTDAALEHVAQIKTLTRLDLYGSGQPGVAPGRNFSAAGLRRLKELPELETLWLTNFIAPGGYAVLKELRQLRELTMSMCDITTQELEALEEALPETQISHHTGGGSWIPKRVRKRKGNSQTDATKASDAPGQPIDAPAPPSDSATGLSAAAPDLPDLYLEGKQVDADSLQVLAGRSWGTVTLAGARFDGVILELLRKADSIHTLRLFGTGLSGQLPRLKNVRGLSGLELGGPLIGRDLRALGELSQLQRLALPQELSINVTGARAVAQLANLKSLGLYNVDIDDASFEELRTLHRLEELDLTHTAITDRGLKVVAAMPRLKRLQLHRRPEWSIPQQLSNDCIPVLLKLSELEDLSISGKITDAGLQQLSGLPKLKTLMIVNTEITGAGLASLENSPVEKLVMGTMGLDRLAAQPGESMAPEEILKRVPALASLRKCKTLKNVTVIGNISAIDLQLSLQKLAPAVNWGWESN